MPEQPNDSELEHIKGQAILGELKIALHQGLVTVDEVRAILPADQQPVTIGGVAMNESPVVSDPINEHNANSPQPETRTKLTAVEIMFYISGIVLFAALMTFIGQSWNNGPNLTHVGMSAGIGLLLWILAAVFSRQPNKSDIVAGVENASVLTGALSIITGGFIALAIILGDNTSQVLIPVAITSLLIGVVHFAYDRIMKKDLLILLGIFASVMTFPLLVSGLIQSLNPAPDVYAIITIMSALLLVYATVVLHRVMPTRTVLKHPFDGLAAFASLGSMFAASFTDYGFIWLMLLICSVFGLFYLSIIRRSKDLLGNAAFFMVVSVLTITFKYFSGYGVAYGLIIATIGLLASAGTAATINKKYFKSPSA